MYTDVSKSNKMSKLKNSNEKIIHLQWCDLGQNVKMCMYLKCHCHQSHQSSIIVQLTLELLLLVGEPLTVYISISLRNILDIDELRQVVYQILDRKLTFCSELVLELSNQRTKPINSAAFTLTVQIIALETTMRLYWQDLRLNVSYSVPQLRHRCINVCTSIKIKIHNILGRRSNDKCHNFFWIDNFQQ